MLYSITKDLHEYSPDVFISDGVKYAADKYDLSWFLNIHKLRANGTDTQQFFVTDKFRNSHNDWAFFRVRFGYAELFRF
jgi:hypothetical protein